MSLFYLNASKTIERCFALMNDGLSLMNEQTHRRVAEIVGRRWYHIAAVVKTMAVLANSGTCAFSHFVGARVTFV